MKRILSNLLGEKHLRFLILENKGEDGERGGGKEISDGILLKHECPARNVV